MTTQRWLSIVVLGLILTRLPAYAQERSPAEAATAPAGRWLGLTSAGDTVQFNVDEGRVELLEFGVRLAGAACFPEQEAQAERLRLSINKNADFAWPQIVNGRFQLDHSEQLFLNEGILLAYEPVKGKTIKVSVHYRLVGRFEGDTLVAGEFELLADRDRGRGAGCPVQAKGSWHASRVGPVPVEIPDFVAGVGLGLVTGQPSCDDLAFTEYPAPAVFPAATGSVAARVHYSRYAQGPYGTSTLYVRLAGDAGGELRSGSCVKYVIVLGRRVKDWEVFWFERADGSSLEPGQYNLEFLTAAKPFARLAFEIVP